MSIENAKWYVLHTYSGYESMVKDNLSMVFKKNNMEDRLYEITIPLEDVVEEKNGKRKIVQRKKFPCYVIVKMEYNNSMWHMVTNTRGVTGFVGPQGRPMPLTEDEIKRMHLEKVVVESNLIVGRQVKIITGPLEGFIGTVDSVDAVNQKCKVIVSMFGRDTPVDLEMYQVEKVD
ncbi:MAG: transcription termination/antitermination protein NusG [Firmicutes bacterium]|nr:transcription termination/antitermination protein NusG [Bacillota bacterium]